MLKFVDYDIVFQEIPNETTLAINLSNCPCHCKGCHSPYLAEDIGEELTDTKMMELIDNNKGVTCVALMGGDNDPAEVVRLLTGYTAYMAYARPNDVAVRTAWYSGRQELPRELGLDYGYINYIKLGPYKEELGGLKSPTTNQRLYEVKMCREIDEEGNPIYGLEDITEVFWKK